MPKVDENQRQVIAVTLEVLDTCRQDQLSRRQLTDLMDRLSAPLRQVEPEEPAEEPADDPA